MKPAHLLYVRYGNHRPRLEPCGLRGCVVEDNGVSSCQHLACPVCGAGPPVHLRPEQLAYCDSCGARWQP